MCCVCCVYGASVDCLRSRYMDSHHLVPGRLFSVSTHHHTTPPQFLFCFFSFVLFSLPFSSSYKRRRRKKNDRSFTLSFVFFFFLWFRYLNKKRNLFFFWWQYRVNRISEIAAAACPPRRKINKNQRVDSEEDLYRLWVEGYQGNATDSLGSHNGYAFSTFDRDNDEAPVSFVIFLKHFRFSLKNKKKTNIYICILFDISLAVHALRLMAEDGGSTGNFKLNSFNFKFLYHTSNVFSVISSLWSLECPTDWRSSNVKQLFWSQSQWRYDIISFWNVSPFFFPNFVIILN